MPKTFNIALGFGLVLEKEGMIVYFCLYFTLPLILIGDDLVWSFAPGEFGEDCAVWCFWIGRRGEDGRTALVRLWASGADGWSWSNRL